MTDFLDEKRDEIARRLGELKPAVDEHRRLEAAAAALRDVAGGAVAPRRRGPGRPRRAVSVKPATAPSKATSKKPVRPAAKRRVGRRKGSGKRAAETLSFVQGQPGMTTPELAAKMGIKQNYLYGVLPGLEQEKKVSKKGRGWHPKGA